MKIADNIRAAVDAAKGPADGTVIRYTRTWRDGSLQYAALFVAGKWYPTGTRNGNSAPKTHQDMMNYLAGDDISLVETAETWETAKDAPPAVVPLKPNPWATTTTDDDEDDLNF